MTSSDSQAHPLLKASWAVLSSLYKVNHSTRFLCNVMLTSLFSKAVKQQQVDDESVRGLAEKLREMLGMAQEYPDLKKIAGTINVIEEMSDVCLKVALLIQEYTDSSAGEWKSAYLCVSPDSNS